MAKESGEVCIAGTAGIWRGGLLLGSRRRPGPSPRAAGRSADPAHAGESADRAEDLPAMAVPMSLEDAAEYADHFARDPHPRWRGEGARLHPGWIAGRCVRLTKHTYHYPAGIHAGSQIQMLAPAIAGQTLVVSGHVTDGYRRKQHEVLPARRDDQLGVGPGSRSTPSPNDLPGRRRRLVRSASGARRSSRSRTGSPTRLRRKRAAAAHRRTAGGRPP